MPDRVKEKLVELKKVLRECLHFNYDEFSCDMYVTESCLRLKDKDIEPTSVQREALKRNLYYCWLQWLKQPAEGV